MKRLRNLIPRTISNPGLMLVFTILISCFLYGLGLLLLFPLLGKGARMLSFPFVWFWALKKGVPGGVIAALLVDVVVADAFFAFAGLPTSQYSRIVFYIMNNMTTGIVVGRLSEVRKSLKGELAERKHMEMLLRESEACFRILFDGNPDPMWVSDLQSLRFLAVNEAAIQHYGYSSTAFKKISVADLNAPEDGRGPLSNLKEELQEPELNPFLECRHCKHDGSIIDVEITSHRVTFLGRVARMTLSHDVTERKKAQAELEYQALHDSLTGLPNRAYFQLHLDRLVRPGKQDLSSFALLLLDLDRFKEINDKLGHKYGDLVLQKMSARLRKALREPDVLARLGGDEFAIILVGTDRLEALVISARLLEAIKEPFDLDGHSVGVDASIGIAVYPDHAQEHDDLLRLSDVAMYTAKNSRSGAVLYNPEPENYHPGRLGLTGELQKAIEFN